MLILSSELLQNTEGIGIFEFVKDYLIGSVPFGFEWVYIFVSLFFILFGFIAFFSLLNKMLP